MFFKIDPCFPIPAYSLALIFFFFNFILQTCLNTELNIENRIFLRKKLDWNFLRKIVWPTYCPLCEMILGHA